MSKNNKAKLVIGCMNRLEVRFCNECKYNENMCNCFRYKTRFNLKFIKEKHLK